ncbi:DUF6056 family protein [Francisella sp. 19X1-34]|uniref:DUF6056 family protein n=1 Tax=Francisella sp. 19X1-34 TaxID=3087177 RepID=UPI002E376C2F|nr:DUF6056 family protein [Francisella sp. 19X1-34]MED7788474.1 DUF6056 family protein [Francisella sp. 19X1-34]
MRKKYCFVFVISILFITYFFLLNYLQPLRADDFGRACTDALNKGFIIYLRGIGSNYFHWTGRITAQALIYLFLNKSYINVLVFIINILNSICIYLFLLLSFRIVTMDKGKILSKDFLLYVFFFIYIFYQTGFIANILWKTAAIQYFWGITLLTIFYYLTIIKGKSNILFSLFIGFFIGLYNEIFVGVTLLLCLAYFIDKKISKKNINKSIIYFFISCFVGGIILVAAPGNYVRLDSASAKVDISIFGNFLNLISQVINSPDTIIPIVLMGLFLVLIFSNKNVSKYRACIYSVALISCIFVLTPVAKSYALNQRVLLIYYVIFFIAFFQQFYNHSSSFMDKLYLNIKQLSWLFSILLVIQLYLIFSIYFSIYKFEQERKRMIVYYHQHNVSNPVLPMLPEYFGQTVYINDITADKSAYNNIAFAKFYDFESVVGVPIKNYN